MRESLDDLMSRARLEGEKARLHSPPNPWVGALVVDDAGVVVGEGHTQVPGEAHAEVVALRHAGDRARGATVVVTLEPCCHVGRTGPCTDALIEAGVRRVVVALADPDPRVAGRGLATLREAGIEVVTGVGAEEVRQSLAPYLWQRATGRPYVVAKAATTLDGVVAMADGTSQWITSGEARADAHLVRAQSQAIIVGAGTVRRDDPALTARLGDVVLEPMRVVLGEAPEGARVHPCLEWRGGLTDLLDELGRRDVVQVLVEGGAHVLSSFVEAGLVNHLVWYIAPALAGGTNTVSALTSLTTSSIEHLRRGQLVGVRRVGPDLRVDLEV